MPGKISRARDARMRGRPQSEAPRRSLPASADNYSVPFVLINKIVSKRIEKEQRLILKSRSRVRDSHLANIANKCSDSTLLSVTARF
ncbi:hypothetical protein CEXT_694471 [Caerostris extrusa]|uniref:Uncharacterized protein n=1 Tax=Caerostris extrusa TaxID=172846 RepID=A0AAV4SYZ3_CAEEX|nr:hypothetical protein CEXT_694471 [Caerostris extrusa]